MSNVWSWLPLIPLLAYWRWMCREAAKAARERQRIEVAFVAIDRASAALRRMGIQAEIAGRRIEEFQRGSR